jgi:hypothetical protein
VKHSLYTGLALAALAGCSDSVDRGTVRVTTFEQERATPLELRAAAECDLEGAIAPGVPVVVHAPDGTLTLHQTDASGELAVELVEGSAVTASYAAGPCGGQHFVTFLAVEPGDHLRFGSWQLALRPPIAEMTVAWPAQTGIEHFEVTDTCGGDLQADGSATGATVSFVPVCSSATAAPDRGELLVVAYADDEVPVSWAALHDFEIADGGALTLDGFAAVTTQSIEITGIPPSVRSASFSASPRFAANDLIRPFLSTYGPPSQGRIAASGPWTPVSDRVNVRSALDGEGFSQQHRSEQVPAAASITIADPALLPWVDRQSLAVDLTARTVQWTQTGDGAYDGALVQLGWERPTSEGRDFFRWTFVVPPGITSFDLPELPAELAEMGLAVSDAVVGSVVLLETSDADGRLHTLPLWEAMYPGQDTGREDYPLVIVSA